MVIGITGWFIPRILIWNASTENKIAWNASNTQNCLNALDSSPKKTRIHFIPFQCRLSVRIAHESIKFTCYTNWNHSSYSELIGIDGVRLDSHINATEQQQQRKILPRRQKCALYRQLKKRWNRYETCLVLNLINTHFKRVSTFGSIPIVYTQRKEDERKKIRPAKKKGDIQWRKMRKKCRTNAVNTSNLFLII